jgi:hypothetical protein
MAAVPVRPYILQFIAAVPVHPYIFQLMAAVPVYLCILLQLLVTVSHQSRGQSEGVC